MQNNNSIQTPWQPVKNNNTVAVMAEGNMYAGCRLLLRLLATEICPTYPNYYAPLLSYHSATLSSTSTSLLSSSSSSLLPPSTSFSPSFRFSSKSNSSHSYASNCRFLTSPFQLYRHISSSPGESNIVLIKSEEEFNTSINKVQDKSLPAIFYFTAVWCGPCRFIAPIIEEFSKNYPQVTIYKIDIDQDGLERTLSKLVIGSVPTLHFFHKGKKAAEIIGADVERIKQTMAKLYQ